MKTLKRIFLAILLFFAVIAGLAIKDGYDMYKDAIEEVQLTEKIEQI